MRLFSVLVLLLCLAVTAAQPRSFAYTKASARFFTDSEYRELIRAAAGQAAADHGVPASVFNERYPAYRAVVERLSAPAITTGFRWAEFTGESALRASAGSAAFVRQKAVYAEQLRKAVVRTVAETRALEGLVVFDESDRIVLFRSVVHIRTNGVLHVVEEITVYNGDGEQRGSASMMQQSVNNEIRRGIRREFPTKYTTEDGFLEIVPFRLLSVTRNGEPEPVREESRPNGVACLIGTADVLLPEGMHTYRIEYETAEQVGWFAEYDELYWNATGNGWSLRIDSAVCELHFPAGARLLRNACYTGVQGANTGVCTSAVASDSAMVFTTTRPLMPYEGLTVAAGIAKGVLPPPSATARVVDFLRDNLLLPVMAVVLLLIVVLNIVFWRKVGRDPAPGTIHPQFEPPPGLSPAEVGYIIERSFKPHLAAAALVDAAVHRRIAIEVHEAGMVFKHPVYTIRPLSRHTETGDDYSGIGSDSDLEAIGTIEKGKYNRALHNFSRSVQQALEERHLVDPAGKKRRDGLFVKNTGWSAVGIVLLVATLIGAFVFLVVTEQATAMMLGVAAALYAVAAVVQGVFTSLMGAYTPQGRAIADHILGFRMYLETAERQVFDALTPPAKTLELFERYLPFAVALEVENQWAAQFEEMLARATAEGSYRPVWYGGSIGDISSRSSFASAFAGGLSSAVSSASTPPGSSRGSGGSSGGGSSGGGGGGGGGGGW